MDRKAILDKIRKKLADRKGGRQRDANELWIPKVDEGAKWKAKGYILPPVDKGDICATGQARFSMDDIFCVQVGDHWINKKKYPCPRVYDNDTCPLCDFGFSLLNETKDKTSRSEISKKYLPRTMYTVNIYFPSINSNPEDLRGKVMYYALPKTLYDKLDECINADGPGEDAEDPQPWGIFYDADAANQLAFNVTHKGGYNDYTESKLLPAQQPIASSAGEVKKILVMRHDLMSKYPERTRENLQSIEKIVNQLLNGSDGDDEDGDNKSGFDSDESSKSSKVVEETVDQTEIVVEEEKPAPAPTKPQAPQKPASTQQSKTAKAPAKAPAAPAQSDDDDESELKALLAKIENGDD